VDGDAPLLDVIDVCRRFSLAEQAVLAGVSFRLTAAGEAIAITGASGSGKSSLLNILGALDAPDSGRVVFAGTDLARLDPVERARFRNREVGFVFQDHLLLPQCSALENVLLPTLVPGAPVAGGAAVERAVDLLARAGLAASAHRRPGELSGGERQRVAVARALINRPRLLLADEPTGSLDQETAASLVAFLCAVRRDEGTGLIVVTHSPGVAGAMDRELALRAGRVVPVERPRPSHSGR
jgi:lipoprotein-releasing system ATP-binding protein